MYLLRFLQKILEFSKTIYEEGNTYSLKKKKDVLRSRKYLQKGNFVYEKKFLGLWKAFMKENLYSLKNCFEF